MYANSSLHNCYPKPQYLIGLGVHVHVPKQYMTWPQGTYIGTTSGPLYILYEHMHP